MAGSRTHTAPVGLIGLGLMGEVYARRLLAAGFAVVGFDTDAAKNDRLGQIGVGAGSPAAIARDCDPIVRGHGLHGIGAFGRRPGGGGVVGSWRKF